MSDVIVKIMAELLYTIAIVTKQMKQKRPCESVLVLCFPWLNAM